MSAGNWKELFRACTEGDLALVKYHVSEGVDLNHQHPEILSTPLVTAILNGFTEIALYLIDHGADVRLESYFDQLTPLKAAKKMNDKVVLQKIKLISA